MWLFISTIFHNSFEFCKFLFEAYLEMRQTVSIIWFQALRLLTCEGTQITPFTTSVYVVSSSLVLSHFPYSPFSIVLYITGSNNPAHSLMTQHYPQEFDEIRKMIYQKFCFLLLAYALFVIHWDSFSTSMKWCGSIISLHAFKLERSETFPFGAMSYKRLVAFCSFWIPLSILSYIVASMPNFETN